jgi:hypothetical protein
MTRDSQLSIKQYIPALPIAMKMPLNFKMKKIYQIKNATL